MENGANPERVSSSCAPVPRLQPLSGLVHLFTQTQDSSCLATLGLLGGTPLAFMHHDCANRIRRTRRNAIKLRDWYHSRLSHYGIHSQGTGQIVLTLRILDVGHGGEPSGAALRLLAVAKHHSEALRAARSKEPPLARSSAVSLAPFFPTLIRDGHLRHISKLVLWRHWGIKTLAGRYS